MEDQPRSKPVTVSPSKPLAVKMDFSKYAECTARNNVQANYEAGVYNRGEGHLETDLAALKLADS